MLLLLRKARELSAAPVFRRGFSSAMDSIPRLVLVIGVFVCLTRSVLFLPAGYSTLTFILARKF